MMFVSKARSRIDQHCDRNRGTGPDSQHVWHHLVGENFHYYFRDKHGNEVDLVQIHAGTFNPRIAIEIKWSDAVDENNPPKGIMNFAKRYNLKQVVITSRTKFRRAEVDGVLVRIIPASWYCLNVGSLASRSAIEVNWNALNWAAPVESESH